MINLDYQSRIPIYEQIISEIERYVALGILKPKEQLMSIREMATTLGINPNTVKKAYSELENKGVIITISTKGTFITDNPEKVADFKIEKIVNEIKSKMKELQKLGLTEEEIIKRIK